METTLLYRRSGCTRGGHQAENERNRELHVSPSVDWMSGWWVGGKSRDRLVFRTGSIQSRRTWVCAAERTDRRPALRKFISRHCYAARCFLTSCRSCVDAQMFTPTWFYLSPHTRRTEEWLQSDSTTIINQFASQPVAMFTPPTHLRGTVWNEPTTSQKFVLVVNPNSSTLMTDGMRSLAPTVPGVRFVYYTAPSNSIPPSIDNEEHEHLSTNECLIDLTQTQQGRRLLERSTGVLVACFSNHPLARLLREQGYPHPALTILETAVLAATQRKDSSAPAPFATITTTADLVPDIDAGIQEALHKHNLTDTPYVGTGATGVRAIELKTLPKVVVQPKIQATARKLLNQGARSLILGCSGTCSLSGEWVLGGWG